ncbi:hypothetical protein E2C01_025007 [Portunus trituberculatus]|uniref:Uncharacterized protein n=1 Tax=Portunus trituberculatus TaxID=210409 RepID=A0A5B7EBX6_PORTR|nr:hypothetical protein [Portunus trituberculatus]
MTAACSAFCFSASSRNSTAANCLDSRAICGWNLCESHLGISTRLAGGKSVEGSLQLLPLGLQSTHLTLQIIQGRQVTKGLDELIQGSRGRPAGQL